MTDAYHWDRFYLHLYYQCPIEKLFAAIATPAGLQSFFVKVCSATRNGNALGPNEFLLAGDHYEFLWDELARTFGEFLGMEQNKYNSLDRSVHARLV